MENEIKHRQPKLMKLIRILVDKKHGIFIYGLNWFASK